jgi:dTDP-4-dehydrorhamnose reductase
LYFDLSEPNLNIDFSKYECVILCAAITNIAQCESEPEKCERINSINTIALIEKCVASKCFVIFLSSNAVFDGKKPFYKHTDTTSPTTKYGEFKVNVEKYIQDLPQNDACVLRLTKVITDSTPFIQNWKAAAENGNEIKAFSNRLISPIDIEDVVDSIQLLVERKNSGIFQLGSSEEISFYEFAKKIFTSEPNTLSKIVATQAPSIESNIAYNSLAMNLPTKEQQYSELLDVNRITMGLMSGHAYLNDPKRLAFTLARYKFVSKMFSGFNKVLEIGCADAFATPLVSEEVNKLVACDFDKVFIDDVKKTHPYNKKISFVPHNIVANPFIELFDGAYALDVLEHIEKSNEDAFMDNICKSLSSDGSCIIGMPSTESQLYASEISKLGHVNCKKGPELKSFLMRHFERVFIFSMNDEVVHTGYTPMAHYLLALCCHPLKIKPTQQQLST